MYIPFSEIMKRVDPSKPYSYGVDIVLDSNTASASAKLNFDNEAFWCNQIKVTGRDNTGKVLDEATSRELILASFDDNFKQKYHGNEPQEVFGLNTMHENRPNFGWLVKPNSEMTVKLQAKPAGNGSPTNTFPYRFHIDFIGHVVEPAQPQ